VVVSEENAITNTQWPGVSYSVHFECVKDISAFKNAFMGMGYQEQNVEKRGITV
jgi:hypothetical protein